MNASHPWYTKRHWELPDDRAPRLELRSPCGVVQLREEWDNLRGPSWTQHRPDVTCPGCWAWLKVADDPEWLVAMQDEEEGGF